MPKGKEQGTVNKKGVSNAAKVTIKAKAKASAKVSPASKSKAKPKTAQPAASCQAASSQSKRKHSKIKDGGDDVQQKKHQDDGSTNKVQKTGAHKRTSCEKVDLKQSPPIDSANHEVDSANHEDESNDCMNVGNGATENDSGNEVGMGLKLTASHQETLEADGFVLLPVVEEGATQEWTALAKLLVTESSLLGHGRDVNQRNASYNGLQLVRAWRVHHAEGWRKYQAGVATVERQMDRLTAKGKLRRVGLPVKTAEAAAELPLKFSEQANEQLLLHGTQPDIVMSLLSMGLNERFSGTNAGNVFGDGIFLAEDVGKTDQYVKVDAKHNPKCDLHRRLYDSDHRHPGSAYYVLAVRAALGHSIRTKTGGQDARSVDTGEKVFPKSFRELAPVPDVSPPLFHHSLIAELGESIRRYREFVVFHGEYVYPEYLLAYQRLDGKEPVKAKSRQRPGSSTGTSTAAPSHPPSSSSSSASAVGHPPPRPCKLRSQLSIPSLPKSSTVRIDIDVPSASVGQVEALGAEYDASRSTWFVPPYQHLKPFEQWIGYHSLINAERNPYSGPIQPFPGLQVAAPASGSVAVSPLMPPVSPPVLPPVSPPVSAPVSIPVSSPVSPPVSSLFSSPVSPPVSPPVDLLGYAIDDVILDCPFDDKDEVKDLGARFDWDNKVWYVPMGMPIKPFKKWIAHVSASATTSAEQRASGLPLVSSKPVYLKSSFKDKDSVKALGARFDGQQRLWYVPPGKALAPFAKWITMANSETTRAAPQSSPAPPTASSLGPCMAAAVIPSESTQSARAPIQTVTAGMPVAQTAHEDTTAAGSVTLVSKTAAAAAAAAAAAPSGQEDVKCGDQQSAAADLPAVELQPRNADNDAQNGDGATEFVVSAQNKDTEKLSATVDCNDPVSPASAAAAKTMDAGPLCTESTTDPVTGAPAEGSCALTIGPEAATVSVAEAPVLNAAADVRMDIGDHELMGSSQILDTERAAAPSNLDEKASAAMALTTDMQRGQPAVESSSASSGWKTMAQEAQAITQEAQVVEKAPEVMHTDHAGTKVDTIVASVVGGGANLEVREISNQVPSTAQSATSADTTAPSFSRKDESVFSVQTSTPAAAAESSAPHCEVAGMPAELQVCGPFDLPVASSEPVYLTSYFHEKDTVKALGARFDGQQRSWYVPPGKALAPFSWWIRPKSSGIAKAAPLHSLATSTPSEPCIASSVTPWGTREFAGAASSTFEGTTSETVASAPTHIDPICAGPSVKATTTEPAAESGQEYKAQESHTLDRSSGVSQGQTVLPVNECAQTAAPSFASSPAVAVAESLELDSKSATACAELQVLTFDLPTASSEPIYLTSSFSEKDTVKALGARFDGLRRSWYVPPGRALAPFAPWIRSKSSDMARATPFQTPLQAAEAPGAIDPTAVVAKTLVAETASTVNVAVGQPCKLLDSTGDQVDESSDEDELLIAAAIAVEERLVSQDEGHGQGRENR